MMRALFLVLSVCGCSASSAEQKALGANPIRKIVTLMQNMQKEIEAEGAKEKELFDKFMCFCTGNNGALATQIADGKAKIDELTARGKSEEAQKGQIAQELIAHKSDRENAKGDLEEAGGLRAKEQSEFEALKADSEKNLAAMAGAIPALEKGMGGASFVQLPVAQTVQRLVESYPNVDVQDRRDVLAFLQGKSDYANPSGQIVGILKAMQDEMAADLKGSIADEEKAVSGFGELKASKEKEVQVATEAIETKTARAGQLAVSVVQTADALEDTTAEVANNEKFIQQLEKECASKEAEFAGRVKVRSEEVEAISQAIAVLNDDDALDVFKKAAPSALIEEQQMGFLQHSNKLASRGHKASALLAAAAVKYNSPQIKLMLYTLNSKLHSKHGSRGMEGVIKMIDDMVALLGKDQKDDEKAKKICEADLEKSADEQKAAQAKGAQVAAALEEATDAVATLTEELASLEQQIKDLDKAVAQATEQRKEEHAEFSESQQLSEAAVQLIGKAKNKLQKFYNPALYVEETAEAASFVQVQAHSDSWDEISAEQPVAPETFSGPVKKNEKSAGVMGLMDMLVKDLETDSKDAAYEEKTAQADYTDLMGDSEGSRSQHTKSITERTVAKAEVEAQLQQLKTAQTANAEDLELVATTIQDLHASCDFILQNFDLRKEARTSEVESLKNAKAILSGANFGF